MEKSSNEQLDYVFDEEILVLIGDTVSNELCHKCNSLASKLLVIDYKDGEEPIGIPLCVNCAKSLQKQFSTVNNIPFYESFSVN